MEVFAIQRLLPFSVCVKITEKEVRVKPQVETTEVFLNYLLTYDVCCVFLGGMSFEKQLLKDESASYSL